MFTDVVFDAPLSGSIFRKYGNFTNKKILLFLLLYIIIVRL